MKVCFLSSAHTLTDKRVFAKEAVSLAAAGFDVCHIAPDTTAAEERLERGVRLIAYARQPGLLGRLRHLCTLLRLGARANADCYHCNEIDSWLVGLLLKLSRRAKVVFDVHEHYPTIAGDRFSLSLLRRAAPHIVRWSYRLLCPLTDRVVLAKDTLRPDFVTSRQRLVSVRNFALTRANLERSGDCEARSTSNVDEPIIVIHTGLISKLRGWRQLLEAISIAQHTETHLSVVGTFIDDSEGEFWARVEELHLTQRVTVERWMAPEDAFSRIVKSHIGAVVFQPGVQNHVFALPHKAFDYMVAGIPVVAPDFAVELAPIIEDADCGILVDTADPESISAALDRLAGNDDERHRLGANGRHAVFTKYNWENEATRLISMYHDLQSVPVNDGTDKGTDSE